MKLLILGVLCCIAAEHVFNMGDYLVLVDEYMIEILNNPFNKTRGRELQFYLEDYYKTLRDFQKEVKKNTVGINNSVSAYMASNGPHFLNIKINNYNQLKDTFKWKDEELHEFKEIRKNVSDLWKVFQNDVIDFKAKQPTTE